MGGGRCPTIHLADKPEATAALADAEVDKDSRHRIGPAELVLEAEDLRQMALSLNRRNSQRIVMEEAAFHSCENSRIGVSTLERVFRTLYV